jgi:hypothetical protein
MNEMKKIVTLLAVFAALSMLAPPALAEPPTPVSGTFDYTFEILDSWTANGNTFLYAVEYEDWEGDFTGTAVAHFTVAMFSSGFWNVHLRSESTGTVGDKQGSMIIQLVGKKPADDDWSGQWVIISGTGELANVRGQGTWGGPGFGAAGPDIWYVGQITGAD